jgi:hypothetical protein
MCCLYITGYQKLFLFSGPKLLFILCYFLESFALKYHLRKKITKGMRIQNSASLLKIMIDFVSTRKPLFKKIWTLYAWRYSFRDFQIRWTRSRGYFWVKRFLEKKYLKNFFINIKFKRWQYVQLISRNINNKIINYKFP